MSGVRNVVLTAAALLVPTTLLACLWDYDTITMERARFPSTLELITGKFLRHSTAFYEWRITDRVEKLKTNTENVELLDDLAVSYDKVGQNDKAIEVALQTESQHPGRYETASNLATFYMHAGRWEDGLQWVTRALEINPNAHFGREKYQKALAEYVIARQTENEKLLPLSVVTKRTPLDGDELRPYHIEAAHTFADFLDPQRDQLNGLPRETVEPAIKGVLGMMRFANHRSPILLEVLGSLLTQNSEIGFEDAKHLACRSYLKASYECDDEETKEAYRDLALMALEYHENSNLEIEEGIFKQELQDAQQWYEQLHAQEIAWIQSGQNPETEFDKLYDQDPAVFDFVKPSPAVVGTRMLPCLGVAVLGGFVVIGVPAIVIYKRWSARSK